MAHRKRSLLTNIGNIVSQLSKKQRIDAVNCLITQFYFIYMVVKSNYDIIKSFIEENKVLYPWLMRDIAYRALKQIAKSHKTTITRVLDSIFTFGDTLSSTIAISHKLELK